MIEGMRADFEGAAQFTNLIGRHGAVFRDPRYIKSAGQPMLREHVRDAQIQRVPVIPTGRYVGCLLHFNPPPWRETLGGYLPKVWLWPRCSRPVLTSGDAPSAP